MHSIIKSTFYIIFIIISLVVGINMLINSKGDKRAKIFGFMVLFLGIGEGFHLVPRILEIFTNDSDIFGPIIDTGRFIASMTIVIVYLMLFRFWKVYYKVSTSKKLDIVLFVLAIISVSFSVIFMNTGETYFIALRNLPTVMIGAIIIYNFKKKYSKTANQPFKYLWLAVLLALLFTVGFELLSSSYPFLIILMMPKTLMYIWIVLMGYTALVRKH